MQLEAEEDARCYNVYIPRVTPYEFERQFQEAYTLAKFKEFQNEIAGKIRCNLSSVQVGEEFSEFDVEEDVIVGENNIRSFTFHVHFNEISREVSCTCRLFEFRAILCKHIIVVYLRKKVYHIPGKYILERWSKNVRRRHTKIKIKYDNWESKAEGLRYNKMLTIFNRVSDKAIDYDEKSQIVMSSLLGVKVELDVCKEVTVCNRPMSIGVHKASTSCHDEHLSWQESNNRVADPIKCCQKGRPPEKRRKSKVETIIKTCHKKSKRATKKVSLRLIFFKSNKHSIQLFTI